MKFVSFQSLLLPALVFLSSNEEAFASKGLRNSNDDAVKDDDDSRKLFFGSLLGGGDFDFFGETFLPNQFDFLQGQFSLFKLGQRPEYCHVKSSGSCKVDESDVCEISTAGACSIGDFAQCNVTVQAICNTDLETCSIQTDLATQCDVNEVNESSAAVFKLSADGAGSYAADVDQTIDNDGNTAEVVDNLVVDINPDNPPGTPAPVRRGLHPADESCIARAEGEVSCEFRNGRCELNVDKVCVLWVDVENDEPQD